SGFRHTVGLGLRQIAFMLVPASVVSAVLAEPIVRLLYQHGHTTADQVPVIAASLAAFSLGLTFNGTMLMLNRGFFSLQSNWVPALVAIVAFGVWWPLDHTLGRSIGAQLVSVNVALAASIAVYLLACRVLGVKELEALLTLRSRFRRP